MTASSLFEPMSSGHNDVEQAPESAAASTEVPASSSSLTDSVNTAVTDHGDVPPQDGGGLLLAAGHFDVQQAPEPAAMNKEVPASSSTVTDFVNTTAVTGHGDVPQDGDGLLPSADQAGPSKLMNIGSDAVGSGLCRPLESTSAENKLMSSLSVFESVTSAAADVLQSTDSLLDDDSDIDLPFALETRMKEPIGLDECMDTGNSTIKLDKTFGVTVVSIDGVPVDTVSKALRLKHVNNATPTVNISDLSENNNDDANLDLDDLTKDPDCIPTEDECDTVEESSADSGTKGTDANNNRTGEPLLKKRKGTQSSDQEQKGGQQKRARTNLQQMERAKDKHSMRESSCCGEATCTKN